jgi:hypothetical protein
LKTEKGKRWYNASLLYFYIPNTLLNGMENNLREPCFQSLYVVLYVIRCLQWLGTPCGTLTEPAGGRRSFKSRGSSPPKIVQRTSLGVRNASKALFRGFFRLSQF